MLQRIQSLYLLAIIICQGLFLMLFSIDFSQKGVPFQLTNLGIIDSNGHELVSDYKQVFVVAIVSIICGIAIAVFKNRKLQVKLSKITGLICLAQTSYIAISFYELSNDPENTQVNIGIASIFVPISLVLSWLTTKAINKDEELIKSVDRIR